jgi:hypothetical protein
MPMPEDSSGQQGSRDREPAEPPHGSELDDGFKGHRRRQARLGLLLTPAQRLRWLEETMEELRRYVGRAREGKPTAGPE